MEKERRWIESEMRYINGRLAVRNLLGVEDEIIHEMKQELKLIKGRVGRVLTIFGNRTREDISAGKCECKRDHNFTDGTTGSGMQNKGT